jgi:hypothetical protein
MRKLPLRLPQMVMTLSALAAFVALLTGFSSLARRQRFEASQDNASVELIALELRRQYSIGYLPSNFVADGKWRRIKVAVTDPNKSSRLVVRSREGYYAVKNPEDHRDKLGTRR